MSLVNLFSCILFFLKAFFFYYTQKSHSFPMAIHIFLIIHYKSSYYLIIRIIFNRSILLQPHVLLTSICQTAWPSAAPLTLFQLCNRLAPLHAPRYNLSRKSSEEAVFTVYVYKRPLIRSSVIFNPKGFENLLLHLQLNRTMIRTEYLLMNRCRYQTVFQ